MTPRPGESSRTPGRSPFLGTDSHRPPLVIRVTPRLRGSSRARMRYPRLGTDSRRPRVRSGLPVSVALHVAALVAFVCVADLAPTPSRFDVFAADPADTASEPLVAQTSPDPPPLASSIRPPSR